MLRIYTSSASRDAKGYFDNELSKGDYYTEYQQVAGRWGGKSAEMLGLVGDVDKDGFHALCDNLHPVTKKKLGVRNKANRRVGYDISFHVPKSVSLVFEYSRDEAIIDAFRQAVAETMSEMEKDVRTQSWQNLKKVKPVTGNMVWAEFIHLTSRPVDGGVPDPHLHAHCFTFNTTYDSKEKRWKAGEFVRFYHDSLYYRTAFHARLAKGLKYLGYGINRTENAFEIAGVPASLIEKFSKRTSQIEKRAKELGITDPELKDRLGAYTRDRKNLQYSKEELQSEWEKQFSPEELLAIQAVVAGKGTKNSGQITAKAAMDHALLHGLERASVTDHKRLLAEALHYGMGDLAVDDVISEGKRSEILSREIDGNLLSTTKEVLAEEKSMTHFARSTLNTKLQLVKDREQILDTELNEEQVAGIKNIWFSYNQVMGVTGYVFTAIKTRSLAISS